ncbi:hypothetical protein [Sphingomonas montanisoli]|uniref:Hemerythrin domain-containing protein n=1 Tax=Sphingomonas montanisoli TaxID=2606412 RepID=A0A5D9C9Z9_9SPHN|nr:hypothetical protein [Sphingomonas montanisoli]TZG27982.1 hypothetical protein FYJ91_10640 [Sphingomonas montanisoli]
MEARGALELLAEHQRKILGIMEGAEQILLHGSASDSYSMSQKRWELLRAMTSYQYYKHAEVLDPMIARGMPDQIKAAKELKARCIKLGDEFRAYVARWTQSGVCDWATYKPEALNLIKMIRLHMAREARAMAMLMGESSYARPMALAV